MTKERKQEIIAQYGLKEGDTGSPEVQVALLTERIKDLLAVRQRPTSGLRPAVAPPAFRQESHGDCCRSWLQQ